MTRAQERPSLWLADRTLEGWLFFASAPIASLFFVPYFLWGEAAIAPAYAAHILLFSLPHHLLTWLATVPGAVRRPVRIDLVVIATLVGLGLTALVPLTAGTAASEWLLTGIFVLSVWHLYRQHFGVCKMYDFVQTRRTGDRTLAADRRSLDLFLGLGSFAIIVYVLTLPTLEFSASDVEHYRFAYPHLPREAFWAYLALTIASGLWAIERCVISRLRRGVHVPWPQLGIVALTVTIHNAPFALLPGAALPLVIAAASVFHNLQYFGFVWLFERARSKELAELGTELALPQRLALRGAWRGYFGIAFGYAFAVGAATIALPRDLGALLIYASSLTHYIVDGVIWRRAWNGSMATTLAALAGPAVSRDGAHATPAQASPRTTEAPTSAPGSA